jgi:hypothetical protein
MLGGDRRVERDRYHTTGRPPRAGISSSSVTLCLVVMNATRLPSGDQAP